MSYIYAGLNSLEVDIFALDDNADREVRRKYNTIQKVIFYHRKFVDLREVPFIPGNKD